jgi:hypothetical protein
MAGDRVDLGITVLIPHTDQKAEGSSPSEHANELAGQRPGASPSEPSSVSSGLLAVLASLAGSGIKAVNIAVHVAG